MTTTKFSANAVCNITTTATTYSFSPHHAHTHTHLGIRTVRADVAGRLPLHYIVLDDVLESETIMAVIVKRRQRQTIMDVLRHGRFESETITDVLRAIQS